MEVCGSESAGNNVDKGLTFLRDLPLSQGIKETKTREIIEKYRYMPNIFYTCESSKRNLLEILADSSFSSQMIERIKRGLECVFNTTNYDPNKDLLYGNKKEIMEEVANKYIDIKDVEAYEYPGKLVTIRLPKIGKFEGWYFQYFLTNDNFSGEHFSSLLNTNPEMGEQTMLFDKLVELMQKIREYMKVRGVDIDKDKDFNTDLGNWDRNLERTDVGCFLKNKAGFGGDKFDNYYIRDKRDPLLFEEPEHSDFLYLWCRYGLFQVRNRKYNGVKLVGGKIILDLSN